MAVYSHFCCLKRPWWTSRLCLQNGATLVNKYTEWALKKASKDNTLLDTLFEADWQRMRSSRQSMNDLARSALFHSAAEVHWYLDHGAEIDDSAIRRIGWDSSVFAPAVQALIQRKGGDTSLFARTGLLQKAAENNRTDLLQVLLDSGLDPNEEHEALPMDRGESPTLALRDALWGGSEDAVRLLLRVWCKNRLGGEGRKLECHADSGKKETQRPHSTFGRARALEEQALMPIVERGLPFSTSGRAWILTDLALMP